MEQHIKLFSTDSVRTSYESSASYETPYVSKVIADNSVHYNKPVVLITFRLINTLNENFCQAEEGMTWEKWVNSKYNSINCFISGNYVMFNQTFYIQAYGPVSPNDTIINEYGYHVTGGTND